MKCLPIWPRNCRRRYASFSRVYGPCKLVRNNSKTKVDSIKET